MVRAYSTHERDDICMQYSIEFQTENLEDLGVDGRIILKCILNKYDMSMRTAFN
jgi:hypothetical protein